MNKRLLILLLMPPLLSLVIHLTPPGKRLQERCILLVSPNYTLHMAEGRGDVRRMRLALQYGANVESPGPYAHRTPLMVAAIHGQAEAARFLLERGANADTLDNKGLTALSLAKKQKHFEVAQLLAAAGAKNGQNY